MATNFPDSLDSFINPGPQSPLSGPSHADQHTDTNEAIIAIEKAIGATNSIDSDSVTYKLNSLSTAVGNLNNSTDTLSELLGIDGNNDLTVTGIENKTTIDSFAASQYSSADYRILISKNDIYESFNIKAVHDNSDIYISMSDIVSNTDFSIANITFENNSGIIGLCVTPVSGSINVRYLRTALKK
jgi:hypothetical protein